MIFTFQTVCTLLGFMVDISWCRSMKKRDLLLRRYWRREDDGTYGTNVCQLVLAAFQNCSV